MFYLQLTLVTLLALLPQLAAAQHGFFDQMFGHQQHQQQQQQHHRPGSSQWSNMADASKLILISQSISSQKTALFFFVATVFTFKRC
jgi:hypothetical protein